MGKSKNIHLFILEILNLQIQPAQGRGQAKIGEMGEPVGEKVRRSELLAGKYDFPVIILFKEDTDGIGGQLHQV